MLKKVLAAGLTLAMVFAMTACGSTNTDTAAGSADSGTASSGEEATIYVSAAASMTESLDKVIEAYKEENPNIDIVPTYDSSGTLQTQIESGSDCDIFISAAQKQMDALEAEDLVDTDTRVDLLENKCALIVAPDSSKGITSWETFEEAIKNAQSSSDLIFCMGNADVPVGQYTSKILTNLGLDETDMVSKGIVTYGTNVKEVTSQVSSGAADCGIVYSTDAYSAEMEPVAVADTELTDGPCIYPAAVMANAQEKDAAEDFLKYLQGDEAMKEFTTVGFTKAA